MFFIKLWLSLLAVALFVVSIVFFTALPSLTLTLVGAPAVFALLGSLARCHSADSVPDDSGGDVDQAMYCKTDNISAGGRGSFREPDGLITIALAAALGAVGLAQRRSALT